MRIVWRKTRVLDTVRGLLVRALLPLLWDLMRITLVGECGTCEEVIDRVGLFVITEETVYRVEVGN